MTSFAAQSYALAGRPSPAARAEWARDGLPDFLVGPALARHNARAEARRAANRVGLESRTATARQACLTLAQAIREGQTDWLPPLLTNRRRALLTYRLALSAWRGQAARPLP